MVCTFNNMTLRNARKSKEYQALLIDLAHMGVVDQKNAEALLGYAIPDYLELPKGVSVPKKKRLLKSFFTDDNTKTDESAKDESPKTDESPKDESPKTVENK